MEVVCNVGVLGRFRCLVGGVDEGRVVGVKMFVSWVVMQVVSEVDVSIVGCCGVEERVFGVRIQSDCGDELIWVICGLYFLYSVGELFGYVLGKIVEGYWFVEVFDVFDFWCGRFRMGFRVDGFYIVGGYFIGVSINKGFVYCGVYYGWCDDVDVYFFDGFNLVGGVEGWMRFVQGVELVMFYRFEIVQVVVVKLFCFCFEEGIVQCFSGIDWYLDFLQVDWLCCWFQGVFDGYF